MGSLGVSAESARNLLGRVQHADNRRRFLDAYRESFSLWAPSTDISQLSVEELVLGGRLAGRLGGWRLSRKLLMAARQREPRTPRSGISHSIFGYAGITFSMNSEPLKLSPISEVMTTNCERRGLDTMDAFGRGGP